MQLIDLKSKALWSGKFTELKSKFEELEVQKCMHVHNAAKVDSFKRNTAN